MTCTLLGVGFVKVIDADGIFLDTIPHSGSDASVVIRV
jgi:hypothetical protein